MTPHAYALEVVVAHLAAELRPYARQEDERPTPRPAVEADEDDIHRARRIRDTLIIVANSGHAGAWSRPDWPLDDANPLNRSLPHLIVRGIELLRRLDPPRRSAAGFNVVGAAVALPGLCGGLWFLAERIGLL